MKNRVDQPKTSGEWSDISKRRKTRDLRDKVSAEQFTFSAQMSPRAEEMKTYPK